jgi:putative membrane protein
VTLPDPPPPDPTAPAPWERLDSRMLVVQPIREVTKFLPVLIGLAIFGSATGGWWWSLGGVVVAAALGVARYLSTRYRVLADRVELRRGLLERHLLSTPMDRVRTVDVTASLIQRLLGLSALRIGTGTASTDADERIVLDGIPTPVARDLRSRLLRAADADAAPIAADGVETGVAAAATGPEVAPPTVVARFSPRWLAYAPFTSGGLALAGAAFGVGSQLVPDVEIDTSGLNGSFDAWWLVAGLGAVAAVGGLTVAAYAASHWGLTISRPRPTAPWHISRGLFTTRETSVDPDRLAGVSVREPLPLRAARGARLDAIVTGLASDDESAGSSLVPPAPRAAVTAAATGLVGSPAPVLGRLVGHGPRARSRRFVRALVPAAVLAAATAGAAAVLDTWWPTLAAPLLLVAALLLARDRARSLGHAVVSEGHRRWLVTRAGSALRRRDVLAAQHVIGWNLTASWFQRRAGLTTAIATTAGGRQRVVVLDVPEDEAVAIARATVPELLEPFLAPSARH